MKVIEHRVQPSAVIALGQSLVQLLRFVQAQHGPGKEAVRAGSQRFELGGADDRGQRLGRLRQRACDRGAGDLALQALPGLQWPVGLARSGACQQQPLHGCALAQGLVAIAVASQDGDFGHPQHLHQGQALTLPPCLGVVQPQVAGQRVADQGRGRLSATDMAVVCAGHHDVRKRAAKSPRQWRDHHRCVGVVQRQKGGVFQHHAHPAGELGHVHQGRGGCLGPAWAELRMKPQGLQHLIARAILFQHLQAGVGAQAVVQPPQPLIQRQPFGAAQGLQVRLGLGPQGLGGSGVLDPAAFAPQRLQ